MKTQSKYFFSTLIFSLCVLFAEAAIKPHSLFSDHMVLQQGVAVPVWGTATKDEKVTVNFNGQTVITNAINGRWKLTLAPLKAGGPFKMEIQGENTVTINDILVGEVWICSGQSNMERQLKPKQGQKDLVNWEEERDAANYPKIRQYLVPMKFSSTKIDDVNAEWKLCTPVNVLDFSAVGYFFAKNLYNHLQLPVGIIFTAYGGTDAEHWANRKDLENDTEFLKVVENYESVMKKYSTSLQKYKTEEEMLLKEFVADSVKAISENSTLPKRPVAPKIPFRGRMPGGLYNAMLYPLLPYAIKGVCWYQGESNNNKHQQYAALLSLMIKGWRNDFNNGDFPFLIVQIAPHKDMRPELREAQWDVTKKISNTALIVTTDCGDSSDIHPAYKQPIGERLALAARALAYKEKIEFSGPQFKNLKIRGNRAIISFTHAGKNLLSKGGELKGFVIAGTDKQFKPAFAKIKGKKIIVYSADVAEPKAVRYGWAHVPDVNLYNDSNLPAVPFTTDR